MSLYKYYSPESFDFICVESGISMRFSQPVILNDPFDVNYATSDVVGYKEKFIAKLLSSQEYDEPTALKIYEISGRAVMKDVCYKIMNEKYGVLSLSRNENSRLMWAHYSKEHTGFMVQLSPNIIDAINNNDLYIHSKIHYSLKRPKLSDLETSDINSILFTKDEAWKYEQEYRLIKKIDKVNCSKSDEKGYSLHCDIFNNESIIRIVLGANSSEVLERKVILWAKNQPHNIEVCKARICDDEFKLIYDKINY